MKRTRKLVVGNQLRQPKFLSSQPRAKEFATVYVPDRRKADRIGRIVWRAFRHG